MSNQCRNCGRDVNNNYTTYANAYQTTSNAKIDKTNNSASTTIQKSNCSNKMNASTSGGATQITAKVMFGSVGAIKELREKEQAEKNDAARAGRRQ